MRIKNKELKARRHRKEQTIKAAIRLAKEQAGDKKPAGAKAPVKKAAPKAKKAE